jgi:hypothetical protein
MTQNINIQIIDALRSLPQGSSQVKRRRSNMVAASLENWANEFYKGLRSCVNRTKCMQAAGLSKKAVFFPLIPKVVASKPRIVLLGMEPSGSWATDNKDARRQEEAGKRCFWCHLGDFTLHFSVREALTEVFGRKYSNEYYIANMAKCALIVAVARNSQGLRWNYCSSIVKNELEHVYREYDDSNLPIVISIGNAPRDYLKSHHLHIRNSSACLIEIKAHNTIPHYSKHWLRNRIDKVLLDNPSLAMRCDSESSVMKKKLAVFIQDVAGPQVFGTEDVRKQMASEVLFSLYAKLSCVYKYSLIESIPA